MLEEATNTPSKPIQDSVSYWKRWLKLAKSDAAKRHIESTRRAWKEYEKFDAKDGAEAIQKQAINKPFPIYWSSCKILEPAYYSRTPKILSRRRCGVNDGVALTMSLIVERAGEYFVDSVDFDDVMQSANQDFIHGDKATTQVTYTREPRRVKKQIPLTQGKKGELLTQDGNPWEGDPQLVVQGEDGSLSVEEYVVENLPKIQLLPCPYDEILHTPDAKHESEIYEKAYYFRMPKSEAEERFKGKEIAYKKGKRHGEDGEDDSQLLGEVPIDSYLEGWECWCKTTGKVYWVSDQYPDGFLDTQDDPYHLRGFFPSPKFIIGSRPSKHLYPTPVFIQLLPLIDELHCAAVRVTILIERIKRRALIDSSNEELIIALNELDEAEYVGVDNLQQIVEKGGVENMVWFVPVKELVQAITELVGLQDKFKAEFFEWFGVPDIQRGQTDPIETANAQELKMGAAHDRFKFPKKLVARLARDSIEMMIDLALNVMDDDQIAEIVNVKYWEQEHQERFQEALSTLRDDDLRLVRVDIDTDSMSFLDDHIRMQKVNMGVTTLARGLEQIAQMIDKDTAYANVALQALLFMLESMGLGKEFEDILKSSIGTLIDKIENPPEDQEPEPDHEMMKIEISRMRAESQAMAKMRELDQKDFKLQIEAMAAQSESQVEQAKVRVSEYKATVDEQVQTFMMQLEGMRVQLEQQRVALEGFKAEVAAKDAMLREIVAIRDADREDYMSSVQVAQTTEPEHPQPPTVINVVNNPPEPPPPITLDREIL